MRLRQILARTMLPAVLAAGAAGAFAPVALAHLGHLHGAGSKTLLSVPPDQPDKGLVYSGLEVATDGTCPNGFDLRGSNLCTHGPDLPPAGSNVKIDVAPATSAAVTPGIRCDGDGTSGKRVQVMYVRASDQPDRYATYVESIRGWAAGIDAIYQDSAAETGGYRQIRFVHDPSCLLSVLNVVLSPTGDDNFSNTIMELTSLGYNLASRKYVLFVDANVYCGIGTIRADDQPGAGNANNVLTSYGRTDTGCWGAYAAAHELMHNLGGVQLSAPNTSGGWHCTDEYDVMCYSDSPNYPVMRIVCADTNHESRLDCSHDDYFSTNPPGGTYLATHWNAANSDWLIATTPPPPPPVFNWAANPSVDFDGDHLTDLGALYRGLSPADSLWFAASSANGGPFQIFFAATTDIPVPGDYNGDGKTDAVIFRPSTGLWYGPQTGAAAIVIQTIVGQAGDIPIPGDYDGDGKTDPAIYRPSTGLFFAVESGGGTLNTTFGAPGDTPVPRDYDGDGKTDPAIYRPNVAAGLSLWYAVLSGGGVYQIYFGNVGDIPVPGDYNGDKKAEAVIFRPASGLWYGPFNGAPGLFQLMLGGPGDIPIPGYYDNNLTEDPAIYRNGTGLWFALNSGGGVARVDGLGLPADVPVQKRSALAGGL